jgi:hypothetical protein
LEALLAGRGVTRPGSMGMEALTGGESLGGTGGGPSIAEQVY